MMLEPLTPAELLRSTLLLAVRDGIDRIVFRPISRYSCEAVAWSGPESWEQVPPSLDDLQALPAELARLEEPFTRTWHSLTRWLRRAGAGGQRGEFRYRVGAGAIRVGYRVSWRRGVVAELEVEVARAAELAGAADARLRELSPPDNLSPQKM